MSSELARQRIYNSLGVETKGLDSLEALQRVMAKRQKALTRARLDEARIMEDIVELRLMIAKAGGAGG
jgi:hypothetical protein